MRLRWWEELSWMLSLLKALSLKLFLRMKFYVIFWFLICSSPSSSSFSENAPFTFFLIFLAELNGAPTSLVHGAYSALFLARVAHAEIGIRANDTVGVGRPIGIIATCKCTGIVWKQESGDIWSRITGKRVFRKARFDFGASYLLPVSLP